MFKRRCSNCEKKIARDFDFCPYCGMHMKDRKKDYGMLGKDDHIDPFLQPIESSSFMDKIIGGVFSSAMKIMEKQFQEVEESEMNRKKMNQNSRRQRIPSHLQLYINGQRIPLESQSIAPMIGNEEDEGENVRVLKKTPKISEETIKKSSGLPRKEAKTKLTRLKDKVIYELDTPGISSLNNVVINKLESSIEIKVYTEKTVYMKTLQIKLPLASYSVRQDKVFLEFQAS